MSGPRVTADDLAGLRRAAEACQVQRWESYFGAHGDPYIVPTEMPLVTRRVAEVSIAPSDYGRAHCEFIGRANPATVLALLDDLAAAQTRLAAVKRTVVFLRTMEAAKVIVAVKPYEAYAQVADWLDENLALAEGPAPEATTP